MKRIGLSRVSTPDQSHDLQLDALRAAGCDAIFQETGSGAAKKRPVLDQVMSSLCSGDQLTVWRLDRVGRSTRLLLEMIERLDEKGVHFLSLREQLDTSTPAGRLHFTLTAGIAAFERDLIRERTMAGLAAARQRGRIGGRPRCLAPADVEQARARVAGNVATVCEEAARLSVAHTTLYRALARRY